MKFQLIFLASSLLAQPFDVAAKVADAQNDQLVGLLDTKTRAQLDEVTSSLNDVVKSLVGIELAKLQLLGDKNGENAILKDLKPKPGNEEKPEKKNGSNKINFENKKDIKKDEKKNDSGLVDDLLDVVTIPGN